MHDVYCTMRATGMNKRIVGSFRAWSCVSPLACFRDLCTMCSFRNTSRTILLISLIVAEISANDTQTHTVKNKYTQAASPHRHTDIVSTRACVYIHFYQESDCFMLKNMM